MARKVAIFGSCVTRDMFNSASSDFELVSYHARISPVSVMSFPLHLAAADLPLEPGFKRRMILADFNKTFFDDVGAAQPEIIIFDFAEKFHLLRQGNSFATLSNDLLTSGFDFFAHYQFEVVNALSARAAHFWKSAASALTVELQAMFPATQFVLHKAYWAQHYFDGEDLLPFDKESRLECTLYNLRLSSYYHYFVRQFKAIDVIEVPAPCYAERDHRWGLSPIHFQEAYYRAALEQLQQLALAY